MTSYICIKCSSTWVEGEKTCYPDISGGVCLKCVTEYVRGRQIKKGYNDCFRRNVEICSEIECDYWLVCNKELLEEENVNY